MSSMFCTVCAKPVQPLGRFRWYDALALLCTYGLWLFVVLFRSRRCPMCRNKGTLLKLR